MASIPELEQTIRAAREMISIIRRDIEGMECGKTDLKVIQSAFYVHKGEVSTYDISRNFEWNGNLFDEGCEDKKNIKDGIETAITECKKVVNQLDVCIQNALNEITKYEKLIADCEAEIARIQAEQAAAAAREAEKNKKVS